MREDGQQTAGGLGQPTHRRAVAGVGKSLGGYAAQKRSSKSSNSAQRNSAQFVSEVLVRCAINGGADATWASL